MTKPLRAIAFAAAFASPTAHAVYLSPQGIGQALIFPYYGVNGGNQTVVSVVNTANDVKAVAVRFHESRNARTVLEFHLYLAPFDVWTGALFALDANGAANLVTLDNSCTVPRINGNETLPALGTLRYAPFRNVQYSGPANDGGGQSPMRTREGHIEVIEMGVLQPGPGPGQLAEEATHATAGTPPGCASLDAAWRPGGAWADGGAAANTNAPTGGLFGSGAVIDVANGTMFAYDADAIGGFFATGNPADDLHFAPVSGRPTFNDARTGPPEAPVSSTVFSEASPDAFEASTWNRTTPNRLAGVDAVSAVLMHDAIHNEYTTDPTLGAATEWVVTFPTKRFYVDDVAFGGPSVLPTLSNFRVAIAPFSGLGFTQTSGGALVGSFACEDVTFEVHDREARTTRFDPGSEYHPFPSQLCEGVNVLTLDQTGAESAVLGTPSTRSQNLDVDFRDGWVRMRLDPISSDTGRYSGFVAERDARSADGDSYRGLPLTGFQVVNVVNANAQPGVLANYGGLRRHRTTSAIDPADPPARGE